MQGIRVLAGVLLLWFPLIGMGQDKGRSVEQAEEGKAPGIEIIADFDGIGYGFKGPQGTSVQRNPSDNSLAVGPNHIIQTVNYNMAIFNKTGKVLYGPVATNNVFKGFGGPCEKYISGDAVVRYDQLADRWLLLFPMFRRLPPHENQAEPGKDGEPAKESVPWFDDQPGEAAVLYQPPHRDSDKPTDLRDSMHEGKTIPHDEPGTYCMCYAVSAGPDPMGAWYRYAFVRPLFPDYPRPAIWNDGYYVPTSTGDHVIEKHACVVERKKMLKGLPAKEICYIIDGVNFLHNADIDGFQLPDDGDPNIMLASGGRQLNDVFEDDGIYMWKIYTDWETPSRSRFEGPEKIDVAPYHYMGDGQLKKTVPQPGTDQRLDCQGDKLMSRLVYRRIGDQQSIVAVHSVNSYNDKGAVRGGGLRWYEFRIDKKGDVNLFQQGTYAPDNDYRWMGSAAMDKYGNIGIGYSYGGIDKYPGQRFAARLTTDPPGKLGLKEAVLVEGEASQTNTMRWMDFTTTAIDPTDDHTIWYVGDYFKEGAENYSTRIGAFRIINTHLK